MIINSFYMYLKEKSRGKDTVMASFKNNFHKSANEH